MNYLYQRGDLYATLGVVSGVAMYAAGQRWRRFHLYLAPALLGMFAKQSALMFAPLLFVYVFLFEAGRSLPVAARASAPAFACAWRSTCPSAAWLRRGAVEPLRLFTTG